MTRSRIVRRAGLTCVLALLPLSRTGAEDTKGKWQFGFGVSYFATTDFIRSNSDIAISGGVVGENGLPTVVSVDERPDVNMLNEPSIRDDSRFDLNASYGLTRWLAVELAASYLKAPVGNIEFFTKNEIRDVTGISGTTSNICGPNQDQACYTYDISPNPTIVRTNSFVPVGEIKEIPVHLSALVRFRPESPLDPYVGLGVGYIMADLKTSPEFQTVSNTLDGLLVASGSKGDFTRETPPSNNCGPNRDQVCTQFKPSAPRAEVRDSFEWHAVSGLDYYVSERFSWYVDARYVWTNGAVDIKTDGDYQVQFTVTDQGQLVFKHIGGCPSSDPDCAKLEHPSTYTHAAHDADPGRYHLWEDTGVRPCVCPADKPNCCPDTTPPYLPTRGDRYYATEDKFGGNKAGDKARQNGALENHLYCSDGSGACAALGSPCGSGGKCLSEDDGVLYILPPGSRDLAEAKEIWIEGHPNFCAACKLNNNLETEDRNGNQFMDTYLLYGVDQCTTADWRSNPKCTGPPAPGTPVRYVYPEGCGQSPDRVTPDANNLKVLSNVGCPKFGDPALGKASTLITADDAGDVYLLQGGAMRLGGFSLGVGVKFTF